MDNQFIPVIGKDVIESLTIGMYEDAKFIFREYIQNSADQIDKAIREGLIKLTEGEIHINLDYEKRSIEIEDNATGISSENVLPILQNIAQSTKIRGVDKGFRGIGRLGGLAYCSRLRFITSSKGEKIKSILTWDAGLLRDIINNRMDKEDAVSVIKKVTTIENCEEAEDKHYFRVILEGVTADELLDRQSIEKYISMVAPLPLGTKFIFRPLISQYACEINADVDEYKIYLNTEQLFKGYTTTLYSGDERTKKKEDEIIDLVFFKEYAKDGNLLYWGWYSVSEKNQSLNQINYSRGFRLRKSNIQIGDEFTLLKLHRDRRFQFYFLGEIHAVHPALIPNSRRDYFIENEVCSEFDQKLKSYFHNSIYKLCYTASEINSSIKKIEELTNFENEFKRKQQTGFTDHKEHEHFKEKYEKKKEEAEKAKLKIEKIQKDANSNSTVPVQRILDRVAEPAMSSKNTDCEIDVNCNKPKYRTDRLTNLTKEQRKFLSQIFSIISDVLDRNTAESLIRKIEEEIK